MLRLFVALPLPETLSRDLEPALRQLRETRHLRSGRARGVPLQNLHVTLKFLGAQPAEVVSPLAAAIDEVTHRSAPIATGVSEYTGLPSVRRARVVVARLHDGAGRLAHLAADIDSRLQPLGIEPDTRRFVAHVTLARLNPSAAITGLIGRLPKYAEDPYSELDEVCLFSSDLGPSGPHYTVLHRGRLRRASSSCI